MKTEHLVVMFNEGKLSELLAAQFDGKIHPPPWGAKDSDFIIFFDGASKIPETDKIKEAIVAEYSRHGCTVEEVFPRANEGTHSLCLKINADREEVWYDICITTHYPFQNGLASMRITCRFNGAHK